MTKYFRDSENQIFFHEYKITELISNIEKQVRDY